MKQQLLKLAATLMATLCLVLSASASPRYILRYTESEPLNVFLARYDLIREATVANRPIHAIRDRLNRPPAELIGLISNETDGDVSIELDQTIALPIRSFTRRQTAGESRLDFAMNQAELWAFFGVPAPRGAITQQPIQQVRANTSWRPHGLGAGIVAVIDTGVDVNHPFFAGRLEPGIDFLTSGGNGSEFTGLPADIVALINPTTTPLLGRPRAHLSNGHAPYWEPDVRNSPRYGAIPIGLGHGTMVAGAVRLVAPEARILPIRAFFQSGFGSLFTAIRAIHAAEDRGARVINLSFNTYTPSPELERTTLEVSERGVILVASTGNDGRTAVPSFPASYNKVTGVASITDGNRRSAFSNAGPDVAFVSAPGEALLLPFPGNRWAGGWGTSFSAPLVSGTAAKILRVNPNATYSELQSALSRSTQLSDPNLGLGALHIWNVMAGL